MGRNYDASTAWAIYGLVDPASRTIRYVGISVQPAQRLARHLRRARYQHTHKANWLNALCRRGETPVIMILERGIGKINGAEAEKWWIAHFKLSGADLTNATDGGDGPSGHHQTDATRAKIAAASRGRRHTPEARAKIAAWHTGYKYTAEARAKMSRAHKGKTLPPETVEKMRAAQRRRDHHHHSPEALARIAASSRARWATAEFRAKHREAVLARKQDVA
jgi:hypothetical protein